MKVGDIVHFKKKRTALYGCRGGGGSYEYFFNPHHRFQITSIHGLGCCNVKNIDDGTNHFITDMDQYLANVEEWRDIQLNKLIQN
jgi:hypothetical protein